MRSIEAMYALDKRELEEIMNTTTVKVGELSGAALDWAVSHCVEWSRKFPIMPFKVLPYSTDWAQGGAIIERERLSITPRDGYWDCYVHDRLFEEDGSDHYSKGETPLIAAMRCYVASKLGDEIELPEELK